jgi:acetylornithine/succinyldiaminopimelate/putrescine aminotransferase/predicted amino acid dehydrogenase
MNSEVQSFSCLSVDAKRDFVKNLFRREQATAAKKVAGRFNPTRIDLLKTFRLDQPIVRGSGHRLYDAQGREYLDFLSQYGAVPFGQNPPELWEIIRRAETEQLASMIQPLVPRDAQQLAERLGEITPGDLEICVFTNSGAEAVEAAIKLARVRTGRPAILSTRNSFHGKTLGALSATGRPMYQTPFFAPVPHFDYVPFGDIDALAQRLEEDAKNIAAFIVEPIQGEGGVIPAPPGYLAAACDLCRQHGVLVIVDEIQTGLGRTGSMFALPAEAGTPDILVLSKALGGGLMPIGACIARPDVWDDRFGILHSSTFANNNLACRIGLGVIDILLRDNGRMLRHVATEGQYLLERLNALRTTYPNVIKDVRGKGFMTGLEFHPFAGDDGSGTLAYCSLNDGLIALFSTYLFNAHRIVTAPTFNSSHVMRLQPPLTVGRAEIDRTIEALSALCDALNRMDCHQIVQHLVDARPSRARASRRTYSTRVRSACAAAAPAAAPLRHGKFAFLLHYSMPGDIVRADPSFEGFTDEELERWRDWAGALKPGVIHHVKDIRSTSASAEGWLIAVPMLPRDMLKLGRSKMVALLEEAKDVAIERGASVLGLGGFTSIVSRGGEDLVGKGMAVSTGNTLTSVMTISAIEDAAQKAGLDLTQASVAVVGATGSIGRLVSLLLAGRVGALTLVGNPGSPGSLDRCRAIADEIYESLDVPASEARSTLPIRYSVNLNSALLSADIVIAATNADTALVSPAGLKPGTLVCDVARPPNVATNEREGDVIVFDGGLVQLPQPITLGPVEGLPPGICWGCLGETILLTLEGEATDWSIGPQLTVSHAHRIAALASRHGIQCAPLQRFGRELTDDDFAGVRNARIAKHSNGHLSHAVSGNNGRLR